MNVALLEKLLGGDRIWRGPCTVVLDADAVVIASGPDHIHGGGVKSYAPRYSSGRIEADATCFLKLEQSIVLMRQAVHKDGTGAEHLKQTVMVADAEHVSAIEFNDAEVLKLLSLGQPPEAKKKEYRPGMLVG